MCFNLVVLGGVNNDRKKPDDTALIIIHWRQRGKRGKLIIK